MHRILIVDALNAFFRAYIVNPTLSPNGQPIGGVVGFLKILQKLCKEVKPDLVVICWDGAGGSRKRKAMNSNYKEGRAPIRLNRDVRVLSENDELQNKIWQQTRTIEYLNELPVVQLMYPEIEADDLVSFVCSLPSFKDSQKVIVSADKDYIQILDKNVVLMRPIQDEILNVKRVIDEYSIHPTNFALARAIAGDKSDNLDGVGGVGLNTVAKRFPFLVENKSFTIDDVLDYSREHGGKIKAYQNVLENAQLIRDNYRIMQLYSPQISIQTKVEIESMFDTFEPQMNLFNFKKMMVQDGFGALNFSVLFDTMKSTKRSLNG
jgi:DNA polymerase-1